CSRPTAQSLVRTVIRYRTIRTIRDGRKILSWKFRQREPMAASHCPRSWRTYWGCKMPSPNKLHEPTTSSRTAERLGVNGLPSAVRQIKITKLKDDGRIFRMAVMALLLIAGLGASMSAQSLNPVPWPTPQVVPPPNIQEPQYQTRPAGVLLAGQIQYASLDATPGLCNKDDNPAPTPDNPPKPDNCKSTGGWIEVNNQLVRIPQGTIVVMPNTFLTWEELFEFNPNTHQTDPVFQTGLAMADTVRFPGTYQ